MVTVSGENGRSSGGSLVVAELVIKKPLLWRLPDQGFSPAGSLLVAAGIAMQSDSAPLHQESQVNQLCLHHDDGVDFHFANLALQRSEVDRSVVTALSDGSGPAARSDNCSLHQF